MMKINFIGAGKLGKNIARQIVINNAAEIQGICNRQSGINAVNFIGQGKIYKNINTLPPADLTFITTPDDDICTCCEKLARSNNLKKESIVAHCSGALTSNQLISVKKKNCSIASVHPLRSFIGENTIQLEGAYCTIEGDQNAVEQLSQLFSTIGYLVYPIDQSKKIIYHAASIFASNYLVTLYESALVCLKEADIEDVTATRMMINLMKNTLDNIDITRSAERSLTGPIKRGDSNTIGKHLRVLSKIGLSELYKKLGLMTLNIANLSTLKKEKIKQVLSILV
ncbi:Rossmann-like and DUF2520 domain-containing protein [Coxiella endosymbiont of Amblyomma nuttalli]|uniref:Rossmann-like and DUF2520 domain-containing protein n=1 Tax=Coxiella endosymbiont of Amblyomma nuttalli TaxID=2749996 RepID=UPI001BA5192D|nr:Rossmann-like and DUF2520 domain-containing protein [Coxiella endosymbiont of Amblyomma nuttalli]QTS83639.1 hypothetical protein CEAn_00090 [Coxiella endosymbiont of Amblyomma nuttalli]